MPFRISHASASPFLDGARSSLRRACCSRFNAMKASLYRYRLAVFLRPIPGSIFFNKFPRIDVSQRRSRVSITSRTRMIPRTPKHSSLEFRNVHVATLYLLQQAVRQSVKRRRTYVPEHDGNHSPRYARRVGGGTRPTLPKAWPCLVL